MASMYASVFPRLPREEPPRSEKLDVAKQLLAGLTVVELATEYARLRGEKERINEHLSACNLHIEAVEQLLIESQDRRDAEWGAYGAGENMLRLMNGDKIEARPEIYCSVSDRDALRAWIVSEGLERHLMVNTQTLNGIVRPMLKDGLSEPPGVSPVVRTNIFFTAKKGAK